MWGSRSAGTKISRVRSRRTCSSRPDRLIEEGLSPEAARLEARKRFGNAALAQERFYYSRRSLWFDQLKQDVRTALRGIKRYPIACAIAVISLGGGIGATTITLLLRNAIFLAPPVLYQRARRVVVGAVAHAGQSARGKCRRACSRPGWTIRPWPAPSARRRQPVAQDLRAGDRTEQRNARAITPDLFTRLGVRPMIGTPLDEWNGAGDPPVLLSAAVWMIMFDGRKTSSVRRS